MSLHVYLDLEKLKNISGYLVEKNGNGLLYGLTVLTPENMPHISLPDIIDTVPKIIEELIVEFSLRESIDSYPQREFGVYRLESAEAILEPNLHNEKRLLVHIKMKSKKLEDLRKLYFMIKEGSIRPDESHISKQTGKTRRWLEEENEIMSSRLRICEARIKECEKAFKESDDKNRYLKNLANNISNRLLPWVFKTEIVNRINIILDDKKAEKTE